MFAIKQFRLLLLMLALFAVAGSAKAQPPYPGLSTTSDASALVDKVANPSVTFWFGNSPGYNFYTLDLYVDYVPSELSFDPAASFLGLHPGLTLTGENNSPGSYSATYGDIFDPTANLSGFQSFAGAFTVKSGLAEGASSAVTLSFRFGNTSGDLDVVDASFSVTRQITSPVPEPETWTLLIGGLVALLAKRRRLLGKSV